MMLAGQIIEILIKMAIFHSKSLSSNKNMQLETRQNKNAQQQSSKSRFWTIYVSFLLSFRSDAHWASFLVTLFTNHHHHRSQTSLLDLPQGSPLRMTLGRFLPTVSTLSDHRSTGSKAQPHCLFQLVFKNSQR